MAPRCGVAAWREPAWARVGLRGWIAVWVICLACRGLSVPLVKRAGRGHPDRPAARCLRVLSEQAVQNRDDFPEPVPDGPPLLRCQQLGGGLPERADQALQGAEGG